MHQCKSIRVALLLAAVSFAGTAAAATTFSSRECNNCSITQLESAAIVQGTGKRYVHDLDNGALYRFQVNREPGAHGNYTYEAIEIENEVGYETAVTYIKDFRDSNNGSLVYRVALQLGTAGALDSAWPSGEQSASLFGAASSIGAASAFDIVDAGPAQNAVTNLFLRGWQAPPPRAQVQMP